MADDEDVPPLEDMTEVLKQADAIREVRLGSASASQNTPVAKPSSAKERAKVKKNVSARAVPPGKMEDTTYVCDHKKKTAPPTPASTTSASTPQMVTKKPETSSSGMFGGMKKGFLFGGPSKGSSSTSKAKDSDSPVPVVATEKKETVVKKEEKDDIPYISPKTGKTESGLSLEEVQQAMSEAKGLLSNQDWITDDLLNKVEKNELLLKRFADPHFMKALEEFQANPTAAMEKYKGNKEVEKFLLEFCSLLGDHFTNMCSGQGATPNAKSTSSQATKPSNPAPKMSEVSQKSNKPSQPRIVEITDNSSETVESSDNRTPENEDDNKNSSKIVEITEDEPAVGLTELKTPGGVSTSKTGTREIRTHHTREEADIQEMPTMEDAQVKEMLKDSKVMEILLDPGIMTLIQTLKTDPSKAQRLIDRADNDLKDKISFLVSKGLLQFQAG